jgi:hypothetical protein
MAMLVEQKVLIFCPGFLVQIVAPPTKLDTFCAKITRFEKVLPPPKEN